MINHKLLLVGLLNDAILAYETEVGSMSIERERQANQIKSICISAQYDAMIISLVKRMIKDMYAQTQGIMWFSRTSRFAKILDDCLSAYKETVDALRVEEEKRNEEALFLGKKLIELAKEKNEVGQANIESQSLPIISLIQQESLGLLADSSDVKSVMAM